MDFLDALNNDGPLDFPRLHDARVANADFHRADIVVGHEGDMVAAQTLDHKPAFHEIVIVDDQTGPKHSGTFPWRS